ncbi:endonuclease-8 [Sinobaca qinghaiensis]|uniref:DNA-(apurinic or apyrimidinic site) lyase n=1 Tax=Sinobaca qinghaiensis TaxID=342944 RepID=A0A419UZQ9_9BACL|nr:endonuclease VIII [Sinobaca qinghaiensis]RKD71175.1 endonuclease-8 [Sinobaca qinghaiensis]
MPEGPEIRRAADQVEQAVKAGPVAEMYFAFPHLQSYEASFARANVIKVETRGKAMLIRFDNGYTIYSHNQLYGKWYVRSAYEYPVTKRQLRLAIHNEKKSALLYSASEIEVLRDEEVEDYPFLAKIGPDILNQETSPEELYERITSRRFVNRKWSSLLLDQSFVAGIGNYLRSEILFEAGIHPGKRPADCTDEELEQAAQALITLVERSYQTGGITVDEETAARLKKRGQSYAQRRHWVFNRDGEQCRIDGTDIQKISAASRRLYFCPTCQPE